MKRDIRVRGVRKKQIDEDKLALAFLMLAKVICEQERSDAEQTSRESDQQPDCSDPEAA